MGITRAAAAELGARRIRVNAVAPSAVPTEGAMRNRQTLTADGGFTTANL